VGGLDERRTVRVGPFHVFDGSRGEVIGAAADLVASADRTSTIFALHVGGLNHRDDERFVRAMGRADLVYADGTAVSMLARLSGATRVQRAATTDIGLPVLERAAQRLDRPVRLAVVGGPPGLAERAAKVIAASSPAVITSCHSGFQDEWRRVADTIAAERVDVLVLGLGMPLEALWCDEFADATMARAVLTCGGWLGFLAGEEKRAPASLQKAGLEWAYRLRQAPARLGPRYAKGLMTTAVLAPDAFRRRLARGARSAQDE
jgi:N-acetylglucosaminyldiphosphoundecaprenol N-acetyl-beta-D-mannosaminyltransferase